MWVGHYDCLDYHLYGIFFMRHTLHGKWENTVAHVFIPCVQSRLLRVIQVKISILILCETLEIFFFLTKYPLDSCLFLKAWIWWSLSWSVTKRSWEIRSNRTSSEKRIELRLRDSSKEKDHYMNNITLTCIHWSTNYVVLRKQTWLWIQNKYYVRKRSRE